VESRRFSNTVTAVIVINAVVLGLETWPRLLAIDTAALWIFTTELGVKL
jgi:hypothetical protein